jgi:hypothetical protein
MSRLVSTRVKASGELWPSGSDSSSRSEREYELSSLLEPCSLGRSSSAPEGITAWGREELAVVMRERRSSSSDPVRAEEATARRRKRIFKEEDLLLLTLLLGSSNTALHYCGP